jgi:hypothetical protein
MAVRSTILAVRTARRIVWRAAADAEPASLLAIAAPFNLAILTRRVAPARLEASVIGQQLLAGGFSMSSYPPYGPGPSSVGRRIDEAIELIEMEVRHAAAYVNAAVIPQVRNESISALRAVADSLRQFADHLEERPGNRPAQPPRPPEAPRT